MGKQVFDERIQKVIRKFVRDCRRAVTRQSRQNLRDLLWFLGDLLDEHLKKTRKHKESVQVSKTELDGLKEVFRAAVGDDASILQAIESTSACISFVVGETSSKRMHPIDTLKLIIQCLDDAPLPFEAIDRARWKKKLWPLFRERPGRRPDKEKQEVFQKALVLVDKGVSYDKIARDLLPDVYAIDRNKARQRIKAGVYRLRQ